MVQDLENYLPRTHSYLWLWLCLSFAIHLIVCILLFVRFESMQFKKGTSLNPHTKVAGFKILSGEQAQGLQEKMSSSALPNTLKTHKTQINNQARESFNLQSLSLYDGKGKELQTSKSNLPALAKFPNVNQFAKRDIEELYGEEFGDYGLSEQEFLVNNLRDIGRITQRYLQYPPSAIRLGQQGVSAVEFYLHPNGDISGLKIILSSDYMLLDRNSERTIEIAYKDYPHPRTKTKIRIFVSYGLYYY